MSHDLRTFVFYYSIFVIKTRGRLQRFDHCLTYKIICIHFHHFMPFTWQLSCDTLLLPALWSVTCFTLSPLNSPAVCFQVTFLIILMADVSASLNSVSQETPIYWSRPSHYQLTLEIVLQNFSEENLFVLLRDDRNWNLGPFAWEACALPLSHSPVPCIVCILY